MASPSNKDSGPNRPLGPYAPERIAQEVAHLNKRGGVRHADGQLHGFRAVWPALLTVVVLLGLFFMDPVLHAYYRGEAIRAYLYLHHYGSDRKAAELLATGIFGPSEIEYLNQKQTPAQSYYPGPMEASHEADNIISYMRGVDYLRAGAHDRLDYLGKVRYQLFVRWGLHPPEQWSVLNPTIHE